MRLESIFVYACKQLQEFRLKVTTLEEELINERAERKQAVERLLQAERK